MITVSDTARNMINAGRYVYHVRASSWLYGVLLADNIPIVAGAEDGDRDLTVMDRVTLTVPRRSHGIDWTPTSDTSPLAARGQTLKVQLGVALGADAPEWFQRGEFLIEETAAQGNDTLAVTCTSLLTLTSEAKFAAPFQPSSSATLGGTLRKLLEPTVLVDLTDAPSDRPVSLTWITWDTDRLAAVWDLLDAWPAEAVMTELGTLRVYSPDPPTVALRTFHDDAGGTLITAAPISRRADPTSVVVATGYTSNGSEIRAVREVAARPGKPRPATPQEALIEEIRRRVNIPAVPRTIDTSLIQSVAEASAVAKFLSTRVARRWKVKRLVLEAAPDPTLQLGDCVGVWANEVWTLGTVERLNLPYTPGVMQVEIASLT